MSRLVAVALAGAALADRINASWDSGDAVLPLDPSWPSLEVERLLTLAKPAVLIDGRGEELLTDPIPVAADTAAVVPTSGTSGEPKLVELTHAALRSSADATHARIGATASHRWLACVPLHHIAGLSILARTRAMGTPPIVHDRFDVDAVDAERDATLVSFVPTMLTRMLDTGADVARFRTILLGGAPASGELLQRARDAGANVVVTYGMTETCGGCVYDGVPLDGVAVDVRDDVIFLRGPVLMRGYRGRSDLTVAALVDGWFKTNDTGSIAADGRLVVSGRVDDLIITGGKKVAPAEVEAVLLSHPSVDDAAVFGVPDDEWGQRVAAVFVSSSDVATDLRALLEERLPRFKHPRVLLGVDEIPRTERGKLDKAALVRLVTGSAG